MSRATKRVSGIDGDIPLAISVDANGNPVTNSATAGTDRSGTAGTAATVLMAANANRRKLLVKNDNDTAVIWINLGGTATAAPGLGNYRIGPGGYMELDGFSGSVSVIASAAATPYSAREF